MITRKIMEGYITQRQNLMAKQLGGGVHNLIIQTHSCIIIGL